MSFHWHNSCTHIACVFVLSSCSSSATSDQPECQSCTEHLMFKKQPHPVTASVHLCAHRCCWSLNISCWRATMGQGYCGHLLLVWLPRSICPCVWSSRTLRFIWCKHCSWETNSIDLPETRAFDLPSLPVAAQRVPAGSLIYSPIPCSFHTAYSSPKTQLQAGDLQFLPLPSALSGSWASGNTDIYFSTQSLLTD